MSKFHTIVIGGGAAGIMAAISAKRKGDSVLICEKMPRLGKKVLVSGNGRCNLLNERLDPMHYNPAAQDFVEAVFAKFGKDDIKDFFKELGLELHSEDGRIFPITNQSASVLKVLEIELKRLSISAELNFEAIRITAKGEDYIVTSKNEKSAECRALIIAGGGKTYPALGSDGGCYKFAEQFGHRMIEPAPSAVPLVIKDKAMHLLQGQKICARAKSVIDGKVASEASGEVLFTKYGLSGTAILDISETISVAINRERKKDVEISIDMMPFLNERALEDEIERRTKRGVAKEELLTGLLPNKFAALFNSKEIKDKRFKVLGTRGWNEAEFTAGGVNTNEVNKETLESKLKKGLYFAGEILDVDGKRGGYNLAWAWASGFVAGLTDAHI